MALTLTANVNTAAGRTDPTQLKAVFQPHGVLSSGTFPAAALTVYNGDGSGNTYFRYHGSFAAGGEAFSFRCDSVPVGFAGDVLVSYGGDLVSVLNLNAWDVPALSPNGRPLAVPQDDATGVAMAAVAAGTLLAVIGGSGAYSLTHNGGVGLAGAAITLNGTPVAADAFLVEDSHGAPLANAAVQLFLASDVAYASYVGTTITGADGRWVGPIKANSGSYTLLISAAGEQAKAIPGIVIP